MSEGSSSGQPWRRPQLSTRSHSNFTIRSAADDTAQLERRNSEAPQTPSSQHENEEEEYLMADDTAHVPHLVVENGQRARLEDVDDRDEDEDEDVGPRRASSLLAAMATPFRKSKETGKSSSLVGTSSSSEARWQRRSSMKRPLRQKVGALPRPVGGSGKLGTFSGVFVPTTLNVLSILMFLRFGFILGQAGFLGMIGMLLVCYSVDFLTTMSLSAIATNGTVRGGGTYYLISRSLGPEFGGSIGIVFYLGMILNTGLNAVGLIDVLKENFGAKTGTWSHWLPEGFWWQYLFGSVVLLVCTAICLAGSGLFARASNGLWIVLVVATLSIPVSALFVSPFRTDTGIHYTGLSWHTFKSNLMPRFTKGAAGSQGKGKETWQSLFGILFPATAGIFAGTSMSGDLKHPSKAIPKGTLSGLVLTLILYVFTIVSLAFTVTRESLYANSNVIAEVNLSSVLVLMGELSTSFFSALMGVIGAAKLLQALARDELIPGLRFLGRGSKKNDEPFYAILLSYAIAQLTMLFNINNIASLMTMAYLLTFLVMNIACLLLKVSSAPNFRPSFHWFSWKTAALGSFASTATMFFVDGLYATGILGILGILFLVIHYASQPKPWGDVSQSLIYHQVRKYLLRLRQEHVKFWRPQILLLVNNPRRQYRLIQFCNSLKKGGLYILGHVIVVEDFGAAVPEAKRQQVAWTKYIDFSKIKAFVNIAINPMFEWGARNLVLSAGLGGMRPNIVVMGFINLSDSQKPLIDLSADDRPSPTPIRNQEQKGSPSCLRIPSADKLDESLPTDTNRPEGAISASSYVTTLEDLLLHVRINVAIAKGFSELELPVPKPNRWDSPLRMLKMRTMPERLNTKKYIDLWPIQMSAEIASGTGKKKRFTTTNFDTYTLILQLGCILHTVPSWARAYKLRIAVFVEYESDVEEERRRVTGLLTKLRIEAVVLVFWLACGSLNTYEIIVNGKSDAPAESLQDVSRVLHDEDWWQDLRQMRSKRQVGRISPIQELAEMEGIVQSDWPAASFQHGKDPSFGPRFEGLRSRMQKRRRASMSEVSRLGVTMGMQTHRLDPDLVHDSSSDTSDSSSEDDSDLDPIMSDSHHGSREPSRPSSSRRATISVLNRAQRPALEPPRSILTPAEAPAEAASSSVDASATPPPSGPTVAFSNTPHPGADRTADPSAPPRRPSIYGRSSALALPALPLSFNDLPCRAQHLILNELIRSQSAHTAVVFTTLPSPVAGTGASTEASVAYLRDLEVLCEGCPPVLMVHSNSMTVTTNL